MKTSQKRMNVIRLARDVVLVSLGRYGQYVVTLATVPLCARLLGVEGTGMLAIATSAYFFGSILVDFGLSQILAARVSNADSIVGFRISYVKLRLIVLSIIILLTILIFMFNLPMLLRMIGLGLVAGGLSSIGEEWVMLGRSEFARIAIYQVIGRIFYLITLFVFLPIIKQPWIPLLCLGFSTIISASMSWYRVGLIGEKHSPDRGIRELLSVGIPSTAARILTTGYSQGSALYYALIIPVAQLGIYSAGDKIVRATSAALDALGVALLPRMSGIRSDSLIFWAKAKRAGVGAFLLGCIAGVALWFSAPLGIAILYGPLFESAIPVLRCLAFLLPAAALSSMIMTSVLYVREDSRGVLLGACLGITAGALGFTVTWILGGSLELMVISVVVVEWVVACFYILRFRRLMRKDLEYSVPGSGGGEYAIT